MLEGDFVRKVQSEEFSFQHNLLQNAWETKSTLMPEEKGRILSSVELAKKRRINQGEKAPSSESLPSRRPQGEDRYITPDHEEYYPIRVNQT